MANRLPVIITHLRLISYQKTKVFPQLDYQDNLDIADYLKVTRQLEDQVKRDIDIEYLKTFLMLQVSKGD